MLHVIFELLNIIICILQVIIYIHSAKLLVYILFRYLIFDKININIYQVTYFILVDRRAVEDFFSLEAKQNNK